MDGRRMDKEWAKNGQIMDKGYMNIGFGYRGWMEDGGKMDRG